MLPTEVGPSNTGIIAGGVAHVHIRSGYASDSHGAGVEVALRNIAEVIGAGLTMPFESTTPEEAPEYFGGMTHLATIEPQSIWRPPTC